MQRQDVELKKHGDVWYVESVRKTRFDRASGKPTLAGEVRVENVALDPEFPEGHFAFEFPAGVAVEDVR